MFLLDIPVYCANILYKSTDYFALLYLLIEYWHPIAWTKRPASLPQMDPEEMVTPVDDLTALV